MAWCFFGIYPTNIPFQHKKSPECFHPPPTFAPTTKSQDHSVAISLARSSLGKHARLGSILRHPPTEGVRWATVVDSNDLKNLMEGLGEIKDVKPQHF